MIPRIAWFPWSQNGPEMSWLRRRSLETFRELNPSWRVVQADIPDDISGLGLGVSLEADWTQWRMLAWNGGFAFDTDIVFLKPVPEEWLDAELVVQLCEERKDVFQMAAVGAKPGQNLMTEADALCEKSSKENTPVGYETFGVPLLRRLTQGKAIKNYGATNIPREAFCFYNWTDEVSEMWSDLGPRKALPESAIGVHWYGGHWVSRDAESRSGPDGVSWIERLAR